MSASASAIFLRRSSAETQGGIIKRQKGCTEVFADVKVTTHRVELGELHGLGRVQGFVPRLRTVATFVAEFSHSSPPDKLSMAVILREMSMDALLKAFSN